MTAAPATAPDADRAGPTFRHLVAAEVRAQLAREPISNRQFAVKHGLKPAWVDRRLNGTTPMDTDDMQFFAEALGISIAELLANALRRMDRANGGVARDIYHGYVPGKHLRLVPPTQVRSDHMPTYDPKDAPSGEPTQAAHRLSAVA